MFFCSSLDIITDILLVNQFMTEYEYIKQVTDINDSRVENSSDLFRPRSCQLNSAQLLEEGYMEFVCHEIQYTYGMMTLGFIYLPAVPVIGAFLGNSIAGILGILWSIIMILFGLGLEYMFGDSLLMPRLASFYLIFFGFFLLWMGLYQGIFWSLRTCSRKPSIFRLLSSDKNSKNYLHNAVHTKVLTVPFILLLDTSHCNTIENLEDFETNKFLCEKRSKRRLIWGIII